mgnify:FL=1
MNPIQVMAMLQNSGNPMQMLTQMAQHNPMMSRAMQMGKGKNEVQLKETVRNLAKQRGMSDEQFTQFLSQFGLKL